MLSVTPPRQKPLECVLFIIGLFSDPFSNEFVAAP
jgi:hypothetical protein